MRGRVLQVRSVVLQRCLLMCAVRGGGGGCAAEGGGHVQPAVRKGVRERCKTRGSTSFNSSLWLPTLQGQKLDGCKRCSPIKPLHSPTHLGALAACASPSPCASPPPAWSVHSI